MMKHLSTYRQLPWHLRLRLTYSTRYRLMTFAFSFPAGIISLCYVIFHATTFAIGIPWSPLPFPLLLCLVAISFLWLNSFFIWAWYNITAIHKLVASQGIVEMVGISSVAPFASMLESAAAFWAVTQWSAGKRKVSWKPTPKTVAADKVAVKEKS